MKIKENLLQNLDSYEQSFIIKFSELNGSFPMFPNPHIPVKCSSIVIKKGGYFLMEGIYPLFSYTLYLLIPCIFQIIGILIAVAFFTLAERKVMAGMQRRKGPNVVGFWGLLQAIADGLKLILKEIIIPSGANKILFIGAPMVTFILALMQWAVIPWGPGIVYADIELSSLYVMALSSLGIYGIMVAGWASNSKYAFLGCLRSAAQMISYEVALGFILVSVVLLVGSFNLEDITLYQVENGWLFKPLLPLVIIFFCSMLAETNRAPFDLPEAEAELVSGYNTEYSSITFALFFLGEYANMLNMSILFSIFFFGGYDASGLFFLSDFIPSFIILPLKTVFFSFFFIWVRATLPRYRYDQLMFIGWKIFLPFTLGFLFFLSSFVYVTDSIPYNGHKIYGLGQNFVNDFYIETRFKHK